MVQRSGRENYYNLVKAVSREREREKKRSKKITKKPERTAREGQSPFLLIVFLSAISTKEEGASDRERIEDNKANFFCHFTQE